MSWLSGYYSRASNSTETREEKRNRLEAERNQRVNQRAARHKQLQDDLLAQEASDEAVKEILAIDPDILAGEDIEINEEEVEALLADTSQADNMPDNDVVIDFEDENGADDARALQEATRSLDRFQWDQEDLQFTFNQLETKMAAHGVKKQYTKLQVLSNILPRKVIDQVKPILRKKESEFQNNAYKQLKEAIMRIYGPRPEDAIERAFNRVMTDTPSELARTLLNDICKHDLDGCQCCPAVIMYQWKKHLPSQVKAGIAHCTLTKDTFESTIKLADQIWAANRPSASVSALSVQPGAPASLDETQPALQSIPPEVNAVRYNRGGRGRGNRRGGRSNRGGGRGGQTQAATGQGPKHKGTKHPDLPAGDWQGCSMHFKWGRGAHFCSEPGSCPWKNVFTPK